jgi:hypothetical protein
VKIIYLDFAKTFDKVPTERLNKKHKAPLLLVETCSGGSQNGWKQRVVLNGKQSTWEEVLSGVSWAYSPHVYQPPERSCELQVLLQKLADDTKLAKVIKSEEDTEDLQRTLNSLVDWAATWGMSFDVAHGHRQEKPKILLHYDRQKAGRNRGGEGPGCGHQQQAN